MPPTSITAFFLLGVLYLSPIFGSAYKVIPQHLLPLDCTTIGRAIPRAHKMSFELAWAQFRKTWERLQRLENKDVQETYLGEKGALEHDLNLLLEEYGQGWIPAIPGVEAYYFGQFDHHGIVRIDLNLTIFLKDIRHLHEVSLWADKWLFSHPQLSELQFIQITRGTTDQLLAFGRLQRLDKIEEIRLPNGTEVDPEKFRKAFR